MTTSRNRLLLSGTVRLWLEYKMRYVVIHKVVWYSRIQGYSKVYVWNMLWHMITVRASFSWWRYFCVSRLLVGLYDYQATNRSGWGGSQRESSLSPIGRLGVIYDSKPPGLGLISGRDKLIPAIHQ
jgi:hypothetical protein